MQTQSFQSFPILRLTIPLATGIFFMDTCRCFLPYEVGAIIVFGLLLCLTFTVFRQHFTCRWWFGMGTFILFFFIGAWRMQVQWKQVEVDWQEGKALYEGTVMEPPVEKRRSVECKVALYGGQSAIFYLEKCRLAKDISMGDRLMLYTQIEKPDNEDVAGGFDYASYLLYKGISGTAYVPSGSWEERQKPADLTWKQRALLLRGRIVDLYREWGIGEKELPLLAALTVGYRAEMDKESREAYSVAGISHVLSLSGMHIGLLWLLISWMLKPLERWKALRWIRWGISTALLWAFAFIAGLEASVVRAVVMCMLMELGRMSGSRPLSMNTLAIAAFFMLLYRPFYLFEVSFQLSFLAVLSILLFYSRLNDRCPWQNKMLRGVWSVMGISLAAQLGTAPLVMYYFSNFSVYFLLANLVAALLVPCIIYTTFGLLAFGGFPWVRSFLVEALNGMADALNAFALWVSGLPYAGFTSIRMTEVEVWCVYGLIGATYVYVVSRRRKAFISLLAIVALLLGIHCWSLL